MARRRDYDKIVIMPESRFMEVECEKCKNVQTVFSKSSTAVDCEKCGERLVTPTGGQSGVRGRRVRVLR
jgi:ribosomal protein S27E